MAENQHNDIFSDSQCLSMDIMERYAGDRLSAAERQAVEKHLVDCPICSDAMEGLAIAGFSDDVTDRIAALNKKISAATAQTAVGFWKKEYYSYAAGFIGVMLVSGLLLNYLKTADIKNQNILSDKIELESPAVEEDVTATTADEKEPAREAEQETAKWSDTAGTVTVTEGTLAAVVSKDAKALDFSITTTEEAGPAEDAETSNLRHRTDDNSQIQQGEGGNSNEDIAGLSKSEASGKVAGDAAINLDVMDNYYKLKDEVKQAEKEAQAAETAAGLTTLESKAQAAVANPAEDLQAKSAPATNSGTKKSTKDRNSDAFDYSSSGNNKESAKTMEQADEYDDPNTLYNAVVPAAAEPEMESEVLADL